MALFTIMNIKTYNTFVYFDLILQSSNHSILYMSETTTPLFIAKKERKLKFNHAPQPYYIKIDVTFMPLS